MSFLRNRIVIVTISITIAVFILAGISNMIKGSPVANVVGVVFSPAQKLVSHIASAVNDFTAFIWEMREYKEENERLVVKLNELQKENRSVEDYKAENERLKDLLGLKQSMSEYSTIAARIIAYEPNNWYDALVIDKGTADGLSEECVVLTSKGIVGQITSIGTNWARVSVITDMENALGVRVVRSGDVAIVEGDV
ncbi:MAG: rod shape-determining protein MreC, partial [Clostridia bacterium]|nr:rod shape-determining protein MreC [Clostridia bacterium]